MINEKQTLMPFSFDAFDLNTISNVSHSMKTVVISGSPRKNANTEIMMLYVYEYAKSKN